MTSEAADQLHNAPEARPAGRSARIAEAVRESCLEILREGGAGALSFENVATRAGVNRATLYRRWESRSRLLSWVLMSYMAEHAPMPDTGSLESDLVGIMLSLDRVMNSAMGGAFFQVMVIEPEHDEVIAEAVRTFWRERIRLANRMIDRGIERGEIHADLDRGFLMDHALGPFFYRLLRRAPRISREEAEILVAHAIATCPVIRAQP